MEIIPESKIIKFEPQRVDFGSLNPGEGATATLNIHGGPGRVSIHSDQLKLSFVNFENGNSVLKVTLLPGTSGELIWDEIVLQTDTEDYRVPVTVRWIEKITEAKQEQSIDPAVAPTKESGLRPKEERTFKGRSCSLCGRNFGYNIDSGSWDRCTCSWYQKVWNIGSHSYKELRFGAKDIPSYFQELWRVILGKEKW